VVIFLGRTPLTFPAIFIVVEAAQGRVYADMEMHVVTVR